MPRSLPAAADPDSESSTSGSASKDRPKAICSDLNATYRRLDTQSLTHAVLSAVRLGIIDLHSAPDPDAEGDDR